MPIYTYRCSNCDVQFDRRQSFQNDALKICPECGQEDLHKVFQPVGIVFKGSGFYSTDNRSPSGQKRDRAHKEEGSPSENSSKETKTEKSEKADKAEK